MLGNGFVNCTDEQSAFSFRRADICPEGDLVGGLILDKGSDASRKDPKDAFEIVERSFPRI